MTSMTMIQGPVTGGIDTHGQTHHAPVIDQVGRHLADREFPTTPAGYRALSGWLRGHGGTLQRVGVEGTGAYGAALTRHLRGRSPPERSAATRSACWADRLVLGRRQLGRVTEHLPEPRPAALGTKKIPRPRLMAAAACRLCPSDRVTDGGECSRVQVGVELRGGQSVGVDATGLAGCWFAVTHRASPCSTRWLGPATVAAGGWGTGVAD